MGALMVHPRTTDRSSPQTQTGAETTILQRCAGERDIAARLMFWPQDSDVPYFPTIFHGVDAQDLSFGCWTSQPPRGWDVFVGLGEMKAFGKALAALNLRWQEFPKPMSFNPQPAEPGSPLKYKVPVPRSKGMQVDVTCGGGSATAELAPDRMCVDMPSLESAFESPRGLYSIEAIEDEAGCKVPGFDPTRLPAMRRGASGRSR